jgi:uncharacterized protein (DUF1015 family)
MITIRPVTRAVVPVDAQAAQQVSAPNYDEFQSDDEIREYISDHPDSALRVTMSHCDPSADAPLDENSPESLARAAANLGALVESGLTRLAENILWIYEIQDEAHPELRQIGLGGMTPTADIRTEATPDGPIIRNEGIRDKKAKGRADLIEATQAYVGVVNNTVDDSSGTFAAALERYADARECDYAVEGEKGHLHKVWLVSDANDIAEFQRLMASEPYAYVADGNHRSAAAAMLGHECFLTVFFTTGRMRLGHYNRLVKAKRIELPELLRGLQEAFTVEQLANQSPYQPSNTHDIGFYTQGTWYRLIPKPSAYDPENAAESIDADIVQRKFLAAMLGIEDVRDSDLEYVGGHKDAAYLAQHVDSGEYEYAITLPPVTMREFVDVCRQGRFMPPKSTWFVPKVRSGLVIALLDEE